MSPHLSRRGFLAAAGTAATGALLASCNRNTTVNPLDWAPLPTQMPSPTPREPETLGAEEGLARLMEGNHRFVESQLLRPDQGVEWRVTIAGGQKPFAVVLGCADSRVPPEILFDQGLGDLFVVRVAGNLLSETILGSLEYAAEHLHVPLFVVLGHERCGAVKAAYETLESEGEAPGHIASLVTALKPAVEAARLSDDPVNAIARENVRHVAAQLGRRSSVLDALVKKRKLRIVGGFYDLDDGAVEIIA